MTEPATSPMTCTACGTALRPANAFCEQCGARVGAPAVAAGQPAASAPLAAPVPPPAAKPRHPHAAVVARRAGIARARTDQSDAKAIRTARIWMVVMALILLFIAGLGWMQLDAQVASVQSNPGMVVNQEVVSTTRAMLAAHLLLALSFFGLVVWAGSNAFAAMMTGLVLWITLQVAGAVVQPLSLFSGLLWKVLIVAAFVGGIRAALNQRRRRPGRTAAA